MYPGEIRAVRASLDVYPMVPFHILKKMGAVLLIHVLRNASAAYLIEKRYSLMHCLSVNDTAYRMVNLC